MRHQAFMADHPVSELAETRLEERDGARWVTGVCPFCWERLAFRAPEPGMSATVGCPNGHPRRIAGAPSEGASHHRDCRSGA
jgi:hypothetical protein